MKDKFFVLFGNCVVVKGYTRSIICDLFRHKIHHIPNEINEILDNCLNVCYNDVIEGFSNDDKLIIEEYINYFITEDLGHYTNDPNLFPQISLDYEFPCEISNCIIDIDVKISSEASKYKGVVNDLSSMNCQSVEIRFFRFTPIENIINFLELFENSRIKSLTIVMEHYDDIVKDISAIIYNYKRISLITIFNCKSEIPNSILGVNILKLSKETISVKDCGNICEKWFNPNIPFFTESVNYNNCLNRKISVDVNGFIKNCPSMEFNFGNIDKNSLKEVVVLAEFKKLWKVRKDDIAICRDCEYRYICLDCRAYISDKNNILSKPIKCDYDPYTSTWENKI